MQSEQHDCVALNKHGCDGWSAVLEIEGKQEPVHLAPTGRTDPRARQQTQFSHIKSRVAYSHLPNLFGLLCL